MNTKSLLRILTLLLIAVLAVAACGSSSDEASTNAESAVEHEEDEEHRDDEEHEDDADHQEDEGDTHSPDDHMAGEHGVPDEAAAVPNPVAANDDSIAAGGALFAATCAVCHGENGHGDGPGAEGLEKKPADLSVSHVQELSDGALFYIISHGKPETPMPAWEAVLDVEKRWQVINFLRTFK